ncbi:cation:proton antiporter subunit C [Halorubrum vacuolatum]|uniref:Multisubunit sodium/proton antiporter, MrpC subunit n=1 Tax=Halorubrum vacuolatum TaxID=63740 RepID=A0A238XZX3_HALVU|nr:cation:proton antiporter subunit C [Halorubrum vacuolatum]SNR63599.1 multisubunit sodium/proton antiporter, MrpC subunit [Halorubrum vacuolatum]
MIEAYHYYFASFTLFLVGMYMMIENPNLIRKIIGLNLSQVAVYLMLVTVGYVDGASPPILSPGFEEPHANPLLHVLVLTAIVVGVALTALALALTIRLYKEFGTLDTREIEAAIAADETGGGSDD